MVTSSQATNGVSVAAFEQQTSDLIEDIIQGLPDPKYLPLEDCRGIIARYTAVLEGNFIYWMTAASLAAKSEQSRYILLDNLTEEVRDSHPLMLRRFALAAKAFPTDVDSLAINEEMTAVRLFLGKLSAVRSVLTMGFFEGFIQKFMPYLAYLAERRGSAEREYTDVHCLCDIEHTEGLFKVLAAEIALDPQSVEGDVFEGVRLLKTLIERVIRPQSAAAV